MSATIAFRARMAPLTGRARRRPLPAATVSAALAGALALSVGGAHALSTAALPGERPLASGVATDSVGTWVVVAEPGRLPVVATAVAAAGGTIERTLPALDTIVVRGVSGRTLRRDRDVRSVSPNVRLAGRSADWEGVAGSGSGSGTGTGTGTGSASVSLAAAERELHAGSLWRRGTGRGVDVALIDTGIAPVAGLTAPGKVINGPDLSFDSPSPERRYVDNNGHGTHMAGIIAGSDLPAGGNPRDASSGTLVGLAPDARLVNVKVGDGHGVTDVSQVLAGIDWVVQHAKDAAGAPGGLNIRVLNISYGTDSAQAAAIDPLAHAAEVAWHHGIVVVASAGNDGDTQGRLSDPAIDPYLIAVGAADTGATTERSDDTVAAFSSRGDGVRDPDVVAPGVHIASLRAPGSEIDQAYGSSAGEGPRLLRGSGTSQAAAMISGSVAALISGRPWLTPDQVKALLSASAQPLAGAPPRAQGGGLVDLRYVAWTPAPNVVQTFPVSTGGGSLEAARGTHHVTLDGVALTGEQDIFGAPFDGSAVAAAEWDGAAWSGGTWNGSSWAGSSWAGSSWAGSSWAGSSWAGSSWAGSSWAGSSWAGSSWAGSSWAGSSWAGSSWAAAVDTLPQARSEAWGGAGRGQASWN